MLVNLLEWLIELRKHSVMTYKWIARGRDTHIVVRSRRVLRARACFCGESGIPTFPSLYIRTLTNLEALWASVVRIFIKIPLNGRFNFFAQLIKSLNEWLNWLSNTSSCKFQVSDHLLGFYSNQPSSWSYLGALPGVTSLTQQRHFYDLGYSKSFWNSVLETGGEYHR